MSIDIEQVESTVQLYLAAVKDEAGDPVAEFIGLDSDIVLARALDRREELRNEECSECNGTGGVECQCECGHEHEVSCHNCNGAGTLTQQYDYDVGPKALDELHLSLKQFQDLQRAIEGYDTSFVLEI